MSWSTGLQVTGDGRGLVTLAGTSAVRLVAEVTGLERELSAVVNPRGRVVVHERGRVLTDAAAMVLAGGEALSDMKALRSQNPLTGVVASTPTLWRTVNTMSPAVITGIDAARAKVRAGVWRRVTIPASRVAGTDLGGRVVLDVDATLVAAHSQKEKAAPTFKRGFGYHPLVVFCDNTQEMLAIQLRPGNAGSNTAQDHIDLLERAIAQVPWPRRRELLIRVDGAGASHALITWLAAQNAKHTYSVQYSVGFTKTTTIQTVITSLPEQAWTPAITAAGDPRQKADVAELTGLMGPVWKDLKDPWPVGMRLLVRRERPHPGAQLDLIEEADGYRYQVFATNIGTGQLAFLDAVHRAHARVEDGIRQAKDIGLGRFPSRLFAINQAWCQIAALAADLKAWLQLIGFDGELATCEIKKFRFCVLTVPARLTRTGRRRKLAFPDNWDWTPQIVTAFARITAFAST